MRRIPTLFLLAPALMAQAPATPAVQTLAQKVAAESKAIEALKFENPVEALAKAKALLPPSKPVFDKTSLQTAFASIREGNANIDIYKLIYFSGVAAGHFEEAKEAAEKGRDLAKELQADGLDAFKAYQATWTKAGEDAGKMLDEIKSLEAKVEATRVAKAANPKPKLSMDEANAELMKEAEVSRRLAFLKSNEATFKDNIEKSKKAMDPLERPMKDMEYRTHEFDTFLPVWEKYLKDEAEDIAAKYKGDKAKYAAGLLRGVAPKPENKEAALVSLHRAAFLDPANSAIHKRIDQINGKAAAPAEKPAKAKAKAKGKK